MSSFTIPDTLQIWVYSLLGVREMLITDATEVRVEDTLRGVEELSFRLRREDPRSTFIIGDTLIEFDGRMYRVRDYDDKHPTIRTVMCDARWIELSWISKPGPYPLVGISPTRGLVAILSGSNWSVGISPTLDFSVFTAEEKDPTLLSMLRRWASITGYELWFDTVNQTVNMVTEVGENKGVGFRYGHNLRTLERKFKPPQATRLYAYGANDLNIAAVNPTTELFVEDYTWYTDQGLTLTQAKQLYRKDFVWFDDSYLNAVNLLDAATAYLANLAQPTLQYKGTVLDLSRLTTSTVDDFSIGDTIRAEDELLGISVWTRVTRRVWYPQNPKADEIELEFINEGLLNAVVSGDREVSYDDIAIIIDENESDVILSGAEQFFAGVDITNTGNVTYVIGATFVATATGTGTIDFRLLLDGVVQGSTRSLPFVAGQVEFSWPTYIADVPEGAHEVRWGVRISAGAGAVTLPTSYGKVWVLAKGGIGVGYVPEDIDLTVVEEVEDVAGVILPPFDDTYTEDVTDIGTPPGDDDWTIEVVEDHSTTIIVGADLEIIGTETITDDEPDQDGIVWAGNTEENYGAGSSINTISGDVPATCVTDDLVVVFLMHQTGASDITAPAGFTRVVQQSGGGTPVQYGEVWTATDTLGDMAGDTLTFTSIANGRMGIMVAILRNNDGGTVTLETSNKTNFSVTNLNSPEPVPTVTSGGSNRLVVSFIACLVSSVTAVYTEPTLFRRETAASRAAGDMRMMVAHREYDAATVTGLSCNHTTGSTVLHNASSIALIFSP